MATSIHASSNGALNSRYAQSVGKVRRIVFITELNAGIETSMLPFYTIFIMKIYVTKLDVYWRAAIRVFVGCCCFLSGMRGRVCVFFGCSCFAELELIVTCFGVAEKNLRKVAEQKRIFTTRSRTQNKIPMLHR